MSVTVNITPQETPVQVDVTIGGTAETIANDSVTNAKLANMAEGTIKLRLAGSGTGDPIDGTASQALTLIGAAEASSLANYLPLAGGSLSGNLASNSSISTTGFIAYISTAGAYAHISTTGDFAYISTGGASAYIETRATFRLFNGTHRTTLSHAPTANRAIAFPDAGGTVALTSDITGTNSGTNTGDLPTNGTNGQALTSNGSGGFGTAVTLGTAATTAATDYATAAQGATADTAVQPASTNTLTNKRITARVTTITSSGTPTINTDNCDMVTITAQAAAITSMSSGLTGTPTNGDQLLFRIKDNGTARAITWGASFVARGGIIPTTTVISKIWTVIFQYNSVTSTWDCVASALEV